MVTNGQRRCKDTKDQKGLGRCLVFHVVLNGVWQKQGSLKVNLRKNQSQENTGICRLANGGQVGSHAQLRQGDGSGTNVLGRVHAKGHGEGLQAQCTVSFDRLEIVDNGNSKTGNRIQNRSATKKERENNISMSVRDFAKNKPIDVVYIIASTSDLQNEVNGTVKSAKHGLSTPPGQGNVRCSERIVSGPSVLLELERRGRVNVRNERSKDR